MTPHPDPVPLSEALRRGFIMRCPNCAHGRLFGRFLKVAEHCPECGEEYAHHRADDFPPYLVILIVGHLIVPAIFFVDLHYEWPVWLECLIWIPVTFVVALTLLQPIKGAIVALQWQVGMHGFALSRQSRLSGPEIQ